MISAEHSGEKRKREKLIKNVELRLPFRCSRAADFWRNAAFSPAGTSCSKRDAAADVTSQLHPALCKLEISCFANARAKRDVAGQFQ